MGMVRNFLRAAQSSWLVGKASILYRNDRLPEALRALERALELVEHRTSPQALSAKMSALKLLSQTAARLGNVALARKSLGEGLKLWTELKLRTPSVRAIDSMNEWERWAREFLSTTR